LKSNFVSNPELPMRDAMNPRPDPAGSTATDVAKVPMPVPFTDVISLDLPELLINRANLPATAKALGHHLALCGHLFERGSRVVKIVHTSEGWRSQSLNVHSTVNEAHEVCQPVAVRIEMGNLVRELVTLPNGVAQLYLNLGDNELPGLLGVCAAPLLLGDGTMRCESGFDPATGLWCTGVDTPLILLWPMCGPRFNAFEPSSQRSRSKMPPGSP
jgi:hypothetical protein